MPPVRPHRVAALVYDRLCIFEFGILVELFGLPRPELPDEWYRFSICSLDPGPLAATAGVRVDAGRGLAGLRTADTIIGNALTERGPEVQWILPPELRKIARRSPGMVGDPDQLGQAMMRNPKLQRLPDNFRQNIRGLVAVAGNRYVLIPAALGLSRADGGGVQADLSLVLADVRNGMVLWRTAATGRGDTPAAALRAAMAAVLPLAMGG